MTMTSAFSVETTGVVAINPCRPRVSGLSTLNPRSLVSPPETTTMKNPVSQASSKRPRPRTAAAAASSHICSFPGVLRLGILAIAFLLCVLTHPSLASHGDRDYRYHDCVDSCYLHTCEEPDASPPLSWDLVLTGWDCEEDCRYECMWSNTRLRIRRGEPIVKYYGKWPFRRFLGLREPASVVFSLLNMWPHLRWFQRFRQRAPTRYAWRRPWLLAMLFSINIWVWSTVYHALGSGWSERLDYNAALLGMLGNTWASMLRIFRLRPSCPEARWLGGVLLVAFLAHAGYLQFVRFDYGWHMTVSVSVAAGFCLLWLSYGLQQLLFPRITGKVVHRAHRDAGNNCANPTSCGEHCNGSCAGCVACGGCGGCGNCDGSNSAHPSTGGEIAMTLGGRHASTVDIGMPSSLQTGTGVSTACSARTAVASAVKPNNHVWQLVASILLLMAAAGLELGDFPPIWDLLDAHALWHLSTPVVFELFYRFLIADALHEGAGGGGLKIV